MIEAIYSIQFADGEVLGMIAATYVGFRVRTLILFGAQSLTNREVAELHERIAAWNKFGGSSGVTCEFTPN